MSTLPSLFSAIIRGERDPAPLTAEQVSQLGAWNSELAAAYGHGYEAGLSAQLQRDAEAVCWMCADPKQYDAAVWSENDQYYHGAGDDRLHWCKATPVWSAWAERAAQPEGKKK